MKKLYSLIFITVMCFPLTINAAFLDISNLNKYNDAVTFLKDRSIIQGYSDGTFKPTNNINRAELTKILIESNKVILEDSTSCFKDVSGDAWFVKYVCTAKKHGWVEGYKDGTFKPDKYINRAEAVKIIAKAENWNYSQVNTTLYSDVDLKEWYGQFVNYAKSNNFLPFDKSFSASTFINRGDFALTYYRILYSEENNLSAFPGQVSEQFKTGLDYEPTFFDSIVLDSPFPSKYVRSEIYEFSGKVSNSSLKNGVLVVFDDQGQILKKYPFNIKDKIFEVDLLFDSVGEFGIGINTGENSKTKIAQISVSDYDKYYILKSDLPIPDKVQVDILELEFVDQSTNIQYSMQKSLQPVLLRFEFVQKDRRVNYYSRQFIEHLKVNYSDFKDFDEGKVSLNLYISNIGKGVASDWVKLKSTNFSAVNHYFSRISTKVSDLSISTFFSKDNSVKIEGVAQDILDADLFVILPDGSVEEVNVEKNYIRSGEKFGFEYKPKLSKTHIFEVNNANGIAVINHPVYPNGSIPLLPDYFDLNNPILELSQNIVEDELKKQLLSLINLDRKRYGIGELKNDSKLEDLAEVHNADMQANNFLGHINLDGENPNDRRLQKGISTPVGENVAKVVSLESGYEHLMRSASHRKNILNPLWNKVGLSIKKNAQGYLYIVQEFSYSNSFINSVFEEKLIALNSNLKIDSSLSNYSEYWTEYMINEDFFSTSNDGETIFDLVSSSDYVGLKSAIVKGEDLNLLLDEIAVTTDIKNASWTKFGFGLDEDEDGLIIISLMWGN